jgi:hypothetical protein
MRLSSASTGWVVLSLLWGCQVLPQHAAQTTLSPKGLEQAATSQAPDLPATGPTSQQSGASQGCYYVWATRDLPDLTSQLQARLVGAESALAVSAYAFGEECRIESEEPRFHAMETDFRVRAQVDSLQNEEQMGKAILAAMTAVDGLPSEQFVGTRPGRVEFEFTTADSESLRVVIDITRFRQEAAGLQGAEIYRHFKAAP